MYFVNLRYLNNYNKDLIRAFDSLLVSFHSSSELFTPLRVGKSLNISKELSYQLLLSARDVGVVNTVYVKKCSSCGQIFKSKYMNDNCATCQSHSLKEGYFFTTDLHHKDLVYH